MRLWTGPDHNLTMLQFRALLKLLFGANPKTDLPKGVFPLCNNTARDHIVAMMPQCDAVGVLKDWRLPTADEEAAWYAGLEEVASQVEEDMIHPTMESEVEWIQRRVAAAHLSQGARPMRGGPSSRAATAPCSRKRRLRKSRTAASSPPSPVPEGLEDEADDEDHVPLAQLRSMAEAKARASASSTADGSFFDGSRPVSPMTSEVTGSHAWDADIHFSSDEVEGYVLIFCLCCPCHLF